MRKLVQQYEKFKADKNTRVGVVMKRMLLKHPIFRLVTFTAFKYLLESGKLFHLKPGGTVYKEDQAAKPNLYFVMYGRYNFTSNKVPGDDGKFGEKLGLGWTVGEEILY